MKKVFLKISLLAVFLLVGLMSAQAQTLTSVSNTDVKTLGTWTAESDALQLLEAELSGPIAQALETLPQGQQFIIWKYKAILYQNVHTSISAGTPVSKSVRINYDQLAGASHLEPILTALSQAEWLVLYNELVDLLTF